MWNISSDGIHDREPPNQRRLNKMTTRWCTYNHNHFYEAGSDFLWMPFAIDGRLKTQVLASSNKQKIIINNIISGCSLWMTDIKSLRRRRFLWLFENEYFPAKTITKTMDFSLYCCNFFIRLYVHFIEDTRWMMCNNGGQEIVQ